MAEEVSAARQQVLADHAVFVETGKWRELLQDSGTPLSTEDAAALKENPKKKFKGRVLHAGHTYELLFKLATMVYVTYQVDDRGGKWFPNLPKNKSDVVHRIGTWIVQNRVAVSRPDMHSHDSEELRATSSLPEFSIHEVLYYLPQREMIIHFFDVWGLKMDKLLQPRIDDKIRLMGIVLNKEQVREFIPDIIGRRRNGAGWQPLDAAAGRTRAIWPRIVQLFTDEEVVITLPEKWLSPDMQEQIDEKAGEEFYNTHGRFDPNNLDRMKLPWDTKTLQAVLNAARSDYEAVMKTYVLGTGGGPGAPENFADWQNRHESYLVKYTSQQAANLYCAIIFMWDKPHGFPLKPPQGPMPPGAGIDTEGAAVEGGGSGVATVSSKKNKGGADFVNAIQEMATARKQSTEDLIKALNPNHSDDDKDKSVMDKQYELFQRIQDMNKTVERHRSDIEECKKKRKQTKEKYADNEKKRMKKLRVINSDLSRRKTMVVTLESTLSQYTEELHKLNGHGKEGNTLTYGYHSSSSDSSESEDEE